MPSFTKALRGALADTTKRAIADATIWRAAATDRLDQARNDLEEVVRQAEATDAELADAYRDGDTDAIARLKARRDDLWTRRSALLQDVAAAEAAAVRAPNERDLARLAVERERAAELSTITTETEQIRANFAAAGDAMVGAAESVAKAWQAYEEVWQANASLQQRRARFQAQYGEAPAGLDRMAVLRVSTHFLGTVRAMAEASETLAQFRTLLDQYGVNTQEEVTAVVNQRHHAAMRRLPNHPMTVRADVESSSPAVATITRRR